MAAAALQTLADYAPIYRAFITPNPRSTLEAMIASIDATIARQVNLILHHPEFQRIEGTWRGVHFLVGLSQTDALFKIKLLDISKRELVRTLRKFRGTAWDQSPIFRKVYEEEYGQFGGEPYGVLVGDYSFDHSPPDVQLLSDIAQIAAAAHVLFIADASPTVMQMELLGGTGQSARSHPDIPDAGIHPVAVAAGQRGFAIPGALPAAPAGTAALRHADGTDGGVRLRRRCGRSGRQPFPVDPCDMGDGRQYRARIHALWLVRPHSRR